MIHFEPGKPPVMHVNEGGDAISWIAQHRDVLRSFTSTHGHLIVRGLLLTDVDKVGAAFRQLGRLVPERERFAPRADYSEFLYSASKWPANQRMCLHNELSYARESPSLMLFACLVPPSTGGETIVASSHDVLNELPELLVQKFEQEGWLLVRNYNDELGESIADAFGLGDRAALERYCQANAIECEWKPGGLCTRQRRKAVVTHAVTGKRCWFNQIAFLNEWTMDPNVREYLLDLYGQEGLAFNTYFGNGESIGRETIEQINEVYDRNVVVTGWKAGDLMLVDNVLTAHGRESYTGPREILAALSAPVTFSLLEGNTRS